MIASAVDNEFGTETYLFPADEHGEVLDWLELPGSMRGTTDHEDVFNVIGYKIVPISLEE